MADSCAAAVAAMAPVSDSEEKADAIQFATDSRLVCPPEFVFNLEEMLVANQQQSLPWFTVELLDSLVHDYDRYPISLEPESDGMIDYETIWKRSHSFKGGSGNIKFVLMSDTAHAVELVARSIWAKQNDEPPQPHNEEMAYLMEAHSIADLEAALPTYVRCLQRRVDLMRTWLQQVGRPFREMHTPPDGDDDDDSDEDD